MFFTMTPILGTVQVFRRSNCSCKRGQKREKESVDLQELAAATIRMLRLRRHVNTLEFSCVASAVKEFVEHFLREC